MARLGFRLGLGAIEALAERPVVRDPKRYTAHRNLLAIEGAQTFGNGILLVRQRIDTLAILAFGSCDGLDLGADDRKAPRLRLGCLAPDRKSVVLGYRVSVVVDVGCGSNIKTNT